MGSNQPVNSNTQVGVANGTVEGYSKIADLAAILQPLLASGATVASGAGVPATAPGAGDPILYIDTSTTPDNLYWWDGSAWNLIGDGVGAGGGLTAVATDATLTGDGTAASPLSVVSSGGGGSNPDVLRLIPSENLIQSYTQQSWESWSNFKRTRIPFVVPAGVCYMQIRVNIRYSSNLSVPTNMMIEVAAGDTFEYEIYFDSNSDSYDPSRDRIVTYNGAAVTNTAQWWAANATVVSDKLLDIVGPATGTNGTISGQSFGNPVYVDAKPTREGYFILEYPPDNVDQSTAPGTIQYKNRKIMSNSDNNFAPFPVVFYDCI